MSFDELYAYPVKGSKAMEAWYDGPLCDCDEPDGCGAVDHPRKQPVSDIIVYDKTGDVTLNTASDRVSENLVRAREAVIASGYVPGADAEIAIRKGTGDNWEVTKAVVWALDHKDESIDTIRKYHYPAQGHAPGPTMPFQQVKTVWEQIGEKINTILGMIINRWSNNAPQIPVVQSSFDPNGYIMLTSGVTNPYERKIAENRHEIEKILMRHREYNAGLLMKSR